MPSPKFKDVFISFVTTCQLWWQDWSNLVTVSLLAILLSLTILLAPVAYFGVLQTCADLAHGTRTGIAGFWSAFKRHWKNAVLWGLICLGSLGPLAIGFWQLAVRQSEFSLAGLLLCGALMITVFPLHHLAAACYFLQEPQTLQLAYKNALALLLLHPGYLFSGSLLSLLLTLLSLRYYLPVFLGVEALLALFSIILVQRTLGKVPVMIKEFPEIN